MKFIWKIGALIAMFFVPLAWSEEPNSKGSDEPAVKTKRGGIKKKSSKPAPPPSTTETVGTESASGSQEPKAPEAEAPASGGGW